ncbi:MAG: TRAP transporter permease [Myxococcota bacterium]
MTGPEAPPPDPNADERRPPDGEPFTTTPSIEALEASVTGTRPLAKPWEWVVNGLAGLMSIYYLYVALVGAQRFEVYLGVYVALTFVLIFLVYPFFRGTLKHRPTIFDIGFALASVVVVAYWVLNYQAITYRAGSATQWDHVMSIVMIVLALEVARRVLGWTMVFVGLVLMAYAYFGPYMPNIIAHRGYDLGRIGEAMYMDERGVWGTMTQVLVNFVIIFIFFGAFLNRSGVGQFFIDLAIGVAGRATGGPAKVSVLASALMGSISGSAIANTVSTGALTIPLMKKTGFKPHMAGAVEASSSIGGMFLPPVMGAGAFVMVELTGIPYTHIMLVSIVPALLYMLSIWMNVHFEAKRLGLKGIPANEVPPLARTLREGWFLAIPIVVVVVLLLMGRSPGYAAFWGVATSIPISWFTKDHRLGPRQIWAALVEGGRNTLVIGATLGIIGILLGVINLTGLSQKFTTIFLTLAGGSSLLAIALIAVASLILGMGMPVTASYLVTAVLAVPALNDLGIPILAAHMIVYWLSQDSNITPPVCIAAYAGAAIALADPWKTGWTAFKYAKLLYVMPLLFAYTPMLIEVGGMVDGHVISSWVAATLGTIAFGAVTIGFLQRVTTPPEWLLLAGATFLCYMTPVWTDLVGVTIVVLLFLLQRRVELSFRRGIRVLPQA